jgi:tetratricopeptide (TPR) repeat protein
MMLQASDLPTNTLYQLALQAWRSGSLLLAIETYRQLERLIDPADMPALAQVRWELGSACLEFDQPEAAIPVLRNAGGAARAAHLPQREAECLTALGQAFRQTLQPHVALTCFQQAHSLLHDLVGADDANARLWNQQGLAHQQLRAFVDAREDYTQALSAVATIADQLLRVEVLQNLGNLCAVDLGEREQGIGYLEEALALLHARNDPKTPPIATLLVRTLGELSVIKMQRTETIDGVSDLLVEAQHQAPLTGTPALTAYISYLMDAATLMMEKFTRQPPPSAASKTGDDEFAFYEE